MGSSKSIRLSEMLMSESEGTGLGLSPVMKKEPSDFSSGLKFPKLDSISAKIEQKFGMGEADPNSKVRYFKDTRKTEILNSIMKNGPSGGGDSHVSARTGLFRTHLLNNSESEDDIDNLDISKDIPWKHFEFTQDGKNLWKTQSKRDNLTDVSDKVKLFIERRKKNMIDSQIHTKISNAYDKMENLENGMKAMDETFRSAKGRLQERGLTRDFNPGSPSVSDPGTGSSSKRIQEIKKLFSRYPRRKTLTADANVNDSNNSKSILLENAPRSTTVEIKESLPDPDKTTNLEVKSEPSDSQDKPAVLKPGVQHPETRVHQEIKDMRSKVEKIAKKADSGNGKMKATSRRGKTDSSFYNGPGNLTRLMTFDPKSGPSKELSDFMQANGGATGGWHKDHHNLFLLAYMKWKHRPSEILRIVTKDCPEKKLQDVAAHLEWFEKFEELNIAKKAYVHEWHIKKRLERQQMYKMSKQDSKARIEEEKSRQEMIRCKRDEEREREKKSLEKWKKSKKATVQKLELENDIIREPDSSSRLKKLDEQLKVSKKKLVTLLPQSHHEARKLLSKNSGNNISTNVGQVAQESKSLDENNEGKEN